LIENLNQSPFNVGEVLELSDFTSAQVADLNRRYDSPLRTECELAHFYRLVGGHPYLVRRGLHEMVSHGTPFALLHDRAARDEWIFGEHLRRMMVLLSRDPELSRCAGTALEGKPCPSDEAFYRLRSAGVLAGGSAQEARPRCCLYAAYLQRRLL
jgi:hypothetical protein